MSEDRWTRDQKIAAVAAAAGVAGVVVNFIKPITDAIGPYYWVAQPFLFLGLGAFMGFSAARALDGKRLAELEKTKQEHEALFKDFCGLTHDEQRQVVGVMLSEPGGLEPTDGQRMSMGNWVKMKDFLRHDPVGDRLHLVDGVREMLLENPQHVYGLMAARVADLEKAASGGRGKNDEGMLLTGDDALNLIRMLTDNQKRALAHFYENGGSGEADPLDAELIGLSRLGLLQRPLMFSPGVDAKWVVPINVNKILSDHPDLLDGFLKKKGSEPDAHGSTVGLPAKSAEASPEQVRTLVGKPRRALAVVAPGKKGVEGGLDPLVMGCAARDDLSRTLREMDFYTKSTLVAVWEHGSADVTWIDPDDPDVYDDMFSEMDETFLRMTNARLRDLELFGLVRYETVSGWDRRWTLEDGVADLLAAHGDALDAAREDAGLTWKRLTEIPGQGCPPSGGAGAKEGLDSLKLRFRSMSFGAKMLCAGIWQNGGIEREPGPTMPAEEEVEEASGAGFVLAEPTSEFGRVRVLATGDLTTLFTERPEEYERVRSDFARGRYQIRDGKLVRVG